MSTTGNVFEDLPLLTRSGTYDTEWYAYREQAHPADVEVAACSIHACQLPKEEGSGLEPFHPKQSTNNPSVAVLRAVSYNICISYITIIINLTRNS